MALLEAFARPLDTSNPAVAHAELLNERYAHWRTRDVLDEVIHQRVPRRDRARLELRRGIRSCSCISSPSVDPAMPVIFIDTGKMFGSTHRYRDEIVARLGLTDVRVARPDPGGARRRRTPIPASGCASPTSAARSARWRRCRARCPASTPGFPAASASRAACARELPLVEADGDRIKINPLADWTKDDVAAYRELHDLPEHPLVADGFRSIGCMPCTTRVADGEDERDGRWRGTRQDRMRHPSRPRRLRDGRQRHMNAEPAGPIWRERRASSPTNGSAARPTPALLAGDYPLLVPLAAFLAEPDRFLAHEGPLGVEVAAGESVQRARAAISGGSRSIALAFPKFSDGRSYSAARLLRERLGFKGELRAVGDVLADQIPLMRRCGIDSFEVHHAPTRAALLAGQARRDAPLLPADPDRAARSAGGHAAVAAAAGELISFRTAIDVAALSVITLC